MDTCISKTKNKINPNISGEINVAASEPVYLSGADNAGAAGEVNDAAISAGNISYSFYNKKLREAKSLYRRKFLRGG